MLHNPYQKNSYQKTTLRSEIQTHQIEAQAISDNMGLVNSLLNHYRGAVDEGLMEDLRQTALMTLILELRKFDHIANEDFRRSAAVRIRGALIDDLRSRDYLNRERRTLVNQIKKAETLLMQKLGREAKVAEVCRVLKISEADYQDAMCHLMVFDDIELCHVTDHFEESEEGQLQNEIELVLNDMPEQQQQVMYLMYVVGLSTAETALSLEINEVKVHRLKHKGIEALKARMKEH